MVWRGKKSKKKFDIFILIMYNIFTKVRDKVGKENLKRYNAFKGFLDHKYSNDTKKPCK